MAAVAAALRWAALAAGSAFVLALAGVAAWRLGYPYHLEWMEGGSVDHLRWLLAGRPLYVEPSIDFVPYGYPPLYYYAAAALAAVIGPGFVALRLLSIAATAGSLWFLYRLVERESGDRAAGFLAAALFAAAFPLAGFWYDVGRVDSLCLGLLLAAVYVARQGEGRRAAIGAGVLLALACLTKQTAMIVAPALVLAAAALRPWRWTAWFAGTALATLGAATAALDLGHGGWYRYYVFELPRRHVFFDLGPLQFLWRDLARDLPVALALGLVYLALALWRRPRRPALFLGLVVFGLLLAGYLVRRTAGGFVNVLMPALAAAAILFGLGVGELRRAARRGAGSARRRVLGGAAEALLFALCLLQLGLLRYDPRTQVPDAADRRAGDDLVARIAGYPGAVLVPELGYLAGLAGKEPFAPWMAWFAVLRVEDPEFPEGSLEEMRQALVERRFDAVIFADRIWLSVLDDELAGYTHGPIDYPEPETFMPRTGFRTRPVVVVEPPEERAPGDPR